MPTLYKYPRTHHLEGSRLQPGDEDTESVPFARLAGRFVVVEEKLDGANAGLCFDGEGRLWLQSRGHFLAGGPREKHFNLFKQWAHTHANAFRPVLGTRYLLYGEWLYAKKGRPPLRLKPSVNALYATGVFCDQPAPVFVACPDQRKGCSGMAPKWGLRSPQDRIRT